MNMKELLRLFNFVYDSIKSNGIIYPKTVTKYVHFNKGYKLTGKEKINIANRLNGYYRRYENIKKIIEAKQEFILVGIKITRKQISRMTGLSLKTVQTHFNAKPIDMDQVLNNLNHPITSGQKDITRTTGIRFKTAFTGNNTFRPPDDCIHPDCSR